MNVLFAASEAFTLIKTGGLGDVIYALPRSLLKKGVSVRLILPAYRDVLAKLDHFRIIGWHQVAGNNRQVSVRVLDAGSDLLGIPLMLVDVPGLFDRHSGGPYQRDDGIDWHDNAERFTVFSRAVSEFSCGRIGNLDWKPDVVHSHDWQTGLVPALLSLDYHAPKSIFTIHNLAYGGHFGHDDFVQLHLPAHWWNQNGVEFYNNFSMLKSGIIFSDVLTTVSPNYAKEITTPAFGYGYDGLLRKHSDKLIGILNGVDKEIWNPETDELISKNYTNKTVVSGKAANKKALLKQFKLSITEKALKAPLLGFVGRLADQKGVDLILQAIPLLIHQTNANFVIVGSGHHNIQNALEKLREQYPKRIGLFIGYSEQTAHLLEAGSDIFLMPSRFEPCGLNQLYSLAYGTLPIVHSTGGLADTVIQTSATTLKNNTATGFVFYESSLAAFYSSIIQAIQTYKKPDTWCALQQNAMKQDFSWNASADKYIEIYARDN